MDSKPFSQRCFSENVCDTRPSARPRMVRLSVTIDEKTEELLQVLAKYGDEPKKLSELVNQLLFEHLSDESFNEETKRAYARWKRDRP